MKEEEKGKGLIDDEEEEEDDPTKRNKEGDLASKVPKQEEIKKKQYLRKTIINDYKSKFKQIEQTEIKVDNNDEVAQDCVMNKKRILNGKITYTSCNCLSCPELGDSICLNCFKTCHQSHPSDKRNFIQKTVNITEVYCSCAECGHVQKKVAAQDFRANEKTPCDITKLIKNTNMQVFYTDKKTHQYYCPFCRRNCLPADCPKIGEVPIDKIKPEELRCSCVDPKYHSKKIDNMSKIQKIFSDKKIDDDICVFQIPGALIKNKKFSKIFLTDLKKVYDDINKQLSKRRKIRTDNKVNLITDKYRNSIRILKTMYGMINTNNSFDFNTAETELLELFNFQLINSLFELFSDAKKEMNQKEISLSNDAYLIQIKIDLLYFYRVFIVMPKTKPFKKYGLLSDTENSLPITRLIAKRYFEEFLQDLNMEKEKFMTFIENIWKTITRYDNYTMEYNLTEIEIGDLINEYMDWLVILSSLRYTKKKDVEFYENVVIESFNSVIKIIKKYKVEPKKIKNKIEEFIKYTFLNYNDEVFYREVVISEKDKQPSAPLLFNLNSKSISQKRKVTDLPTASLENKEETTINKKVSELDDIQEEEDLNETKIEENSFSTAKFSFESGPLQESLLYSLFAFKKDVIDTTPDFKKWEIYDWIASENDFYIESLKSFYEAYNTKSQDGKLLMKHFRNLAKPEFEIKLNLTKTHFIKQITKEAKDLKALYSNYFFIDSSPKEMCEKLLTKLYKIQKLIENNLKIGHELSSDGAIERKIIQIYMVKIQLVDYLYSIYNQFQYNTYIIKYVSPASHIELVTVIFDILSLISLDNIITTSLLFSNDSVELFLNINNKFRDITLRTKATEATYYFKWLKNVKNFKFNLEKFTSKLFKIFSYFDNIFAKRIVYVKYHLAEEKKKKGLQADKKISSIPKEDVSSNKDDKKDDSPEEQLAQKKETIKDRKIRKSKIEVLGNEVVDKLQSEGECLYRLDLDFSTDDIIDKIIVLINCMIKCCKLSTQKSVVMTNNIILDLLSKILVASFFNQIWEKYKKSLSEILIDDDDSNVPKENRAKKSVLIAKLHDLKAVSLIDTDNPITDSEQVLIIQTYKLITKIDEYSFYIITDHIPKYDIKSLLQEKMQSMKFIDRRVFSFIYSRLYFVSPFNILSMFNPMNAESMTKLADCNLNGGVMPITRKELHDYAVKLKEEEEIEKKRDGMFGNIILDKPEEKAEEEKEKENKDKKSNKVAFSFWKAMEMLDFSLGLEPLFFILSKYRKLMKQFFPKDITKTPHLFVKYFKDVILYPSVFSLYKVLYFTPVMSAKYKYLIYKITYLFLECLKYFYETMLQNQRVFLKDKKFDALIREMFIIESKDENEQPQIENKVENEPLPVDQLKSIETYLKDTIRELAKDIEMMNKDPKFEPLSTIELMTYFCKYIKNLKDLQFLPLELDGKCYKIEQKSDEENFNFNSYLTKRLYTFITNYENTKQQGLESDNLLFKLFSENTPEDEPEVQQIKINIILDIILRINFKQNVKENPYARGKEDSFILTNIVNKIYKADPDLWHNTLVNITSKTKQIFKDIITQQLSFVIQYVYIDYHKLRNVNFERGENPDLSPNKKFLILLEYLRLFCENHHKIFQTILMNFTVTKMKRNETIDTLGLLNFILKLPTMAKNSIEYSDSKSKISGIFKIPDNTFYNELLIGITDFLIEIIQGCFESNMRLFSLPGENISVEKKEAVKAEDNENKDQSDKRRDSLKGIKGSKKMELLRGNVDFKKYIDTGYYCLDNVNNETDKFFLAHFLRFITCFFEECSNPRENKESLIKIFNPKKLINGLSECTVNLYKEFLVDKEAQKNKLKTLDEVLQNENGDIILPEKFSKELKDVYISNSELQENFDFIICSNIFRYLSISSQYKSAERVRQCLRELKLECDEDEPIITTKNRNSIIAKREAYRFFSQVVKDVEIFYKPKEPLSDKERKRFKEFFTLEQFQKIEGDFKTLAEEKGNVQKVVYFVNPNSLFTEDSDRQTFIDGAPAEKNEKLNYLLEYLPAFKANMSIRKKLWKKQDNVLTMLYNVNYQHAIFISIFLSIIINILVLSSSFYINLNAKKETTTTKLRNLLVENSLYGKITPAPSVPLTYENITSFTSINPVFFLEDDSDNKDTGEEDVENKDEGEKKDEDEEEQDKFDNPKFQTLKWQRQEINTPLIIVLTIINIIFIICVLGNWLFFEYLKSEKEEEEVEDDQKTTASQGDIVRTSGSSGGAEGNNFSLIEALKKLFFSDIQVLIWNLLIGIIALISVSFHFLYSMQLFTMFILIETMYTVIYSVKIKYKQFLSAGLLIVIVSLLFAMVKYKWFTAEDECFTYSECFLDVINTGIRGGSGMGFSIKKLGESRYLIEFFLEWVFFFSIMLILLNVINGVIVDTFQELREKSNEEKETKLNICFICSLHRGLFERKGIDFESHKDYEHNILNYFHYIYKVEMTDEQELNSLDYEVRQSIKNKRTDFFPVNTCVSMNTIGKKSDE